MTTFTGSTNFKVTVDGCGGVFNIPSNPTGLRADVGGGFGWSVPPSFPYRLTSDVSGGLQKPSNPTNLEGGILSIPNNPTNLEAKLHIFEGTTKSKKYKGWVYDSRTDSLSGPFFNESVTTLTTKDNSSEMYCVNEQNEVKKTDLLEFNNPYFKSFADPFTEINTAFDTSTEEGIVLSKTGKGFCYRNKFMSKPFEEPVSGGGLVEDPLFFRQCYLANAETNWLHLGDEHNEKQLFRVDLRFHKNSCGHLWMYVKNDEGIIKGQYKGAIKEHMKVFTNLRGRSFRIQMMVATHTEYPWAMREMAIGHLYGKSF